jgi:hypothetical protein
LLLSLFNIPFHFNTERRRVLFFFFALAFSFLRAKNFSLQFLLLIQHVSILPSFPVKKKNKPAGSCHH